MACYADVIKKIAQSPKMARQMGEFNRVRIEGRFTLTQMVDAYRLLFEELHDRR